MAARRPHPPQGHYASHLVSVSVLIMRAIRNDLGMPLVNDEMLSNFVSGLLRQSGVSYSTLLTGLLYLLRFRHGLINRSSLNGTGGLLKPSNPLYVMVMFVVALMLGSKFLHDRHASNQAWAASAYLPVELINAAEIDFLYAIQHRLHVDQTIFQRWVAYLFQSTTNSQGEKKLDSPASQSPLSMAPRVPSAASSPLSYSGDSAVVVVEEEEEVKPSKPPKKARLAS